VANRTEGYTSTVQDERAGDLRRLRALRTDLPDPRGGAFAKFTGAGLSFYFPTVELELSFPLKFQPPRSTIYAQGWSRGHTSLAYAVKIGAS
jgi:hypothetical protein